MPRRSPASGVLVVCFVLGFTTRALAEIQTFQTDYAVRFYVQIEGQREEFANEETGTFRYDGPGGRAIYYRTSKQANGEEWVVQNLFHEDKNLSVTWRTNGSDDDRKKQVSGRPDQTRKDWLSFLGGQNLGPVTGHLLLGQQGQSLSELAPTQADAATAEWDHGDYKIQIERQPEHGNSIVRLSWSRLKPLDPNSESIEPIGGGYTVESFKQIGDRWLPVRFRASSTQRAGRIRLPGNLKIAGNPDPTVPGKTFTAEVTLVNPQVNLPLPDELFKIDVEQPARVVNWNAPHIRHVLVNNTILPEVDALAAGLITNAEFHPPTSRWLLLYLNLGILALVGGLPFLVRWIRGRSAAGLLVMGTLGLANSATAAESANLLRHEANGPYCGIYSVLAGLRAIGNSVPPESAIHTRYLGSYQGSTGQELARLVTDCGARAEVFEHLALEHLESSVRPIVLHFKSTTELASYNHWVTFLGVEKGLPLVYDPPEQMRPIRWQELAARWDGVGIVLSARTDPPFNPHPATAFRFAKAATLFVTAYGLALLLSRMQPRTSHLLAYLVFLVSVISLVMTAQSVSSAGLVTSPHAITTLMRRHFPSSIPVCSTADVNAAVKLGGARLLDARFASDYRNGTIPGALSLPVDSSIPDRETVLARIPRSQAVIVFCESSTCSFADQIALFLRDNGYQAVSIYRAGYSEWIMSHDR